MKPTETESGVRKPNEERKPENVIQRDGCMTGRTKARKTAGPKTDSAWFEGKVSELKAALENLPQHRQKQAGKELAQVTSATSRRLQEIRDGGRTLRRTVRDISESGRGGFIERGYVQYEGGLCLVTKTKPRTWWNLVRAFAQGESRIP